MRLIKSPRVWIALSALIVVIVAGLLTYIFTHQSVSSTPSCNGATQYYGGVIDSVNPARHTVKLYDPKDTQATSLSRVSVVVTTDNDTHVYRQQGSSCREVALSDLKAGQVVRAWSRYDVVVAMYPVPITASKIVIVG